MNCSYTHAQMEPMSKSRSIGSVQYFLIHSSHSLFPASVSHCEVSTRLSFLGFNTVNLHGQCCRQSSCSMVLAPLPHGCQGRRMETDGPGTHGHTGQRADFEAFTACFGGGDTPEDSHCSKGKVYVSRATVGTHALPVCHSRKKF